ncbi:MAG: hypothetical protein RBG13Loki_0729 [Promethearchaeota archaeon CR_4]|nr:MAG: hypothetical protein RBG13Loki_0729 [Candidatus Lokiarchaeota archaeon CR_4]
MGFWIRIPNKKEVHIRYVSKIDIVIYLIAFMIFLATGILLAHIVEEPITQECTESLKFLLFLITVFSIFLCVMGILLRSPKWQVDLEGKTICIQYRRGFRWVQEERPLSSVRKFSVESEPVYDGTNEILNVVFRDRTFTLAQDGKRPELESMAAACNLLIQCPIWKGVTLFLDAIRTLAEKSRRIRIRNYLVFWFFAVGVFLLGFFGWSGYCPPFDITFPYYLSY